MLLWLALLLALAQVLAVRHAYTHSIESTSSAPAKHPGGIAHCDLCVVAAGMGAGAPPAASLVVLVASAFVPAAAPSALQHAARVHRPYAIRAPPVIAS